MQDDAKILLALLQPYQQGPSTRKKYPDELKLRVGRFLFQQHKKGVARTKLAKTFNISSSMVYRWEESAIQKQTAKKKTSAKIMEAPKEKEKHFLSLIVPKEEAASVENSPSLTITSSSGFTLQGLSLKQAIHAMQALQ